MLFNLISSLSSKGKVLSESIRSNCCLLEITLVFTVVFLTILLTRPSVEIPFFSNKFMSLSPEKSSPITPQIIGFAPKASRFRATFPAPPIRASSFSRETIGTGASGLMRFTLPIT